MSNSPTAWGGLGGDRGRSRRVSDPLEGNGVGKLKNITMAAAIMVLMGRMS